MDKQANKYKDYKYYTPTWNAYQSPYVVGKTPESSASPAQKKSRLPWILFTLTVISTILAGTLQQGLNPLAAPFNFVYGLPFAITLLLILGVHEMGHYTLCRIHHIPSTVPYFIPMPNILGTMGAFIKIKGIIPNRRALVDIGMSGPLAGFVIALPATVIGLILSEPVPQLHSGGIEMGSSLLVIMLEKIFYPSLPDGFHILLHPVGFAGYIGMLVTALNLMPIGQLDGGHIASALFGRLQWKIARYGLVVLFVFGLFWQGWWFWLFLLLIIGYKHPVIRSDARPIDSTRLKLAYATIAIFFLTFVPVPFVIN